ncbi:unnamed protein product [Mytilus coruscus]|uniref:Uncharacterized protein n=1 Tax=Mytilus coruscus TaxID=42192 RepID=A0A6J8CAL5_MYTCO|nr:unnamed protein product [Mytilus coruscus]
MVINQVQNYEKGVVDKQTETDAVIILSDEKNLQNILTNKPTPKTRSASTQTDSPVHNFPKQVSSAQGPNTSNSSTGQISNALQYGTTAGQNMQTSSVTRPRIHHLPPIDEHDIVTSESDIVSTPAEIVNYTSLDTDISPGTSFNSTPVTTISLVLHLTSDIRLPLNSITALLPEANITPAPLVSTSIHQASLQPTLPLSFNSSFTRGIIHSSLALHHFRPANVYNCYPGSTDETKSKTDIEIDFLELRIHPDSQ